MQDASKKLTESLHEVYEPDWYGREDVKMIGEVRCMERGKKVFWLQMDLSEMLRRSVHTKLTHGNHWSCAMLFLLTRYYVCSVYCTNQLIQAPSEISISVSRFGPHD